MRERGANTDPIIGLDATYSVGRQLSGVGKYSLALFHALEHLDSGIRFRHYYRMHRWMRSPWSGRPLLDRAPRGIDIFHGLNQRLPVRGKALMVSTFHDLFVLSAEYSSPEFRARFTAQAQEAASRSDFIIAVSSFTAGQIAEYLGYPRTSIRVVPHGVDLPAHVASAHDRAKVVLTVGAVQKRKNTRRLIEAFRSMPSDWELWIAGSVGFEAGEMLKDAPSNVKVLGYVSDADLARLYQQAAIFAFPSLDEGFGIPVLEAMANGLPVITSNRSALPEVAGDAAILVDPFDVEQMGAAMRQLVTPSFREHWIASGFTRAAGFSWKRAAEMTVAVYRELLGGKI